MSKCNVPHFKNIQLKKLCEARAAVSMFVRPRGKRNLRKTSNAAENLKDNLNLGSVLHGACRMRLFYSLGG